MTTNQIIQQQNRELKTRLLKSITKDLPIYCNSITDPREYDELKIKK